MRNDNQAGSISVVVAILSTLLLIAVSVFAFWVYGQMQDYKLHSDQKAAAAVSAGART
jgi:Tfp pilus assembly protein FimT